MNDESMIRRDRMRFTKNTQSSRLAILAIVFDVFYFVSIYQSDVGNFYYSMLIGASIVYNLLFMLAAFLCSEGVKNYKKNYSYLLVALGVLQIVRIFILPMKAHNTVLNGAAVMGNGQFIALVVLLIASAVCLLASAAINFFKCTALTAHMKTLGEKAA